MQKDRQPNEIRTQRKGDHRIPKVRSSTSLGRHRSSDTTRFKPNKSKSRRKRASRDQNGGVAATTDDTLGAQLLNGKRDLSPPQLRGSTPTQDSSATPSRWQPAASSVTTGSGPSPETSQTDGTLHAVCHYPPIRLVALAPLMIQQSESVAHTQKSSRGPRELMIGGRGRGRGGRNMPKKFPPPILTEHRLHSPEFSGVGISHDEKQYLGPVTLDVPAGDASHTHQSTSDQSPAKPVEHEPIDIIDLTLDSSGVEGPGTLGWVSSSVKFENTQNAFANPNTLVHSSSDITPSNPSPHGFSTASTIFGPTSNLIKNPRDKPRLFVRYTLGLEACLANISAHGFVEQICVAPRWRRETIRTPEEPTLESVHDACVLSVYGSTISVLAHARENTPVTIHRLHHLSPVHLIGSYDRPTIPEKPTGLGAICSMMQPLSFATGGADHAIHIWDVDRNFRATCSRSPLMIKHTSKIHSLLPIRDSSHKLVSSGADCRVNVYDLSSERVVNTIMLSNPGFHVHHLGNPTNLLIQTAHREHQFEIRDLRTGSINETQMFGFASGGPRLSSFARGDVAHSTLFACGDLRGRVYIWDLRNIKQPASQVKCFQTEIRNVIWHESHILASSDDNSMAAIPYNYTNSVV